MTSSGDAAARAASVSFDRMADRYEETRGGLERGRRFAKTLSGFLAPRSSVLEIGVGTAAVARPMAELGHSIVGIDISRAMLDVGRARLPGALLQGDATVLPLRAASVDAVSAIWAVHVVGDQDALLTEVGRVMKPGGRFLVVSPTPDVESNDLTDIAYRLGRARGRGWDRSVEYAPRAASFGFSLIEDIATDVFEFEETPNARAAAIERRDSSTFWNLDDETWATQVEPVLAELRALPNPDRARHCVQRHVLSVYQLDNATR